MNRENQSLLVAFMSVLLLRMSFTNDYLSFVKTSMRPWLILSGGVLALLAVTSYLRGSSDEMDEADHGHHAASKVAWLMVLPFAAVFVITPGPLGAYAANRAAPRTPPAPPAASETDGAFRYPPLPRITDGARDMALTDFVSYAIYDPDHQLLDQRVRLTGFVTPDGTEDGFKLTRFVLACCAADASPISVVVTGLKTSPPAADTWLAVEGTWLPDPSGDEPDTPALTVASVRTITQPDDPYEG